MSHKPRGYSSYSVSDFTCLTQLISFPSSNLTFCQKQEHIPANTIHLWKTTNSHIMESLSPSPELEHIKSVWARMSGNSPIYDFLFGPSQELQFLSASKGNFKCTLKLSPVHVNSRGTIHGSVSATIVDWAGGLAIATHGMDKSGVSVDIHVTYMSTAKAGDTVMIEGIANKVGRNLAFTDVRIYKVEGEEVGGLVASATHTKFVRQ